MAMSKRESRNQERRCDLVFEGGGVKGIGLAGAFSVLDERGYQPQNVAGSSAGAITAALVAAGYRGDELKRLVLGMDFRKFMDKSWEDRVPLIGRFLSLWLDQGIFEGKYFCEWMDSLLEAKGVRTFADLRTRWDEPPWNCKLQVTASDLTSHELLVLPRDAAKLGLDPLTLKVSDAVRMSMSIPAFFEPVKLMDPVTRQEHMLVDGGLLSNFPVWIFDTEGQEPDWPTFGLMLVEPAPQQPLHLDMPERGTRGLRGLRALALGLTQAVLEARDRLYLERAQFVRTITIPTLGVRTTEFGIRRDRAEALYMSGRAGAEQFLSTWDFDAYVKEFRSGKHFTRRELVHQQLLRAAPMAQA